MMEVQDLVLEALVKTLAPAAGQVRAAIRHHTAPAKSVLRHIAYHDAPHPFQLCAACGAPIAVGQFYVNEANDTGTAVYHIDLPACLNAVQAIVQLAFDTAII